MGIKSDLSSADYMNYANSAVFRLNAYYNFSKRFNLGFSIAYNRWKPHDDWIGLFDLNSENAITSEITGHQNVFVVTPKIRILLLNKSVELIANLGLVFDSLKATPIVARTTFSSGSVLEVTLKNGNQYHYEKIVSSNGTSITTWDSDWGSDYCGSGVGPSLELELIFFDFLYFVPEFYIFQAKGWPYRHFSLTLGIDIIHFTSKNND